MLGHYVLNNIAPFLAKIHYLTRRKLGPYLAGLIEGSFAIHDVDTKAKNIIQLLL
jgi:hypothetical protein